MELDRAWLRTPPGPGAIAVIRLSGPGVGALLARHFSKPPLAGRCVHGELRDTSGAIIDDPVVALIDANTADLNVHGGGAIIRGVLALAEQSGFLAESPPIDAFAADVIEQEVLAALPLAKTKLGLIALLSQITAWRGKRWTPQAIAGTLADTSLHWLLHPPTVALVGLPNAGKSTLANQLFGQQRSIVFDQPGTTRDWIGEYADIDGLPILLIDTPGIRGTHDPLEAAAIRQSRAQLSLADLVVLVIDLTQPQPPQVVLEHDFPASIRVINKADLQPRWNIGHPRVHRTVAATGQGVDDLRGAIRRHFLGDSWKPDELHVWTERQRRYLSTLAV